MNNILTIAGYDGYPLHLAQTRSRGVSLVSLSRDRSVDFPVNRIFQCSQLIGVHESSWAQIANWVELYCFCTLIIHTRNVSVLTAGNFNQCRFTTASFQWDSAAVSKREKEQEKQVIFFYIWSASYWHYGYKWTPKNFKDNGPCEKRFWILMFSFSNDPKKLIVVLNLMP